MRHIESSISLLGLAVVLLAWTVPQDRMGYEVQFAMLGAGLMAIGLGLVLLVDGAMAVGSRTQLINYRKPFPEPFMI
jgi:hypothetical protein